MGSGCFAGGVYANAPSRTEDGTPEVDLVWQMLTDPSLGYRHVKTSHHLLFGLRRGGGHAVRGRSAVSLHGQNREEDANDGCDNQSLYVDNVGCPSAGSGSGK